MLLSDTDIWLALELSGHVHHPVSRAWLDTIDEPGFELVTTDSDFAQYGGFGVRLLTK